MSSLLPSPSPPQRYLRGKRGGEGQVRDKYVPLAPMLSADNTIIEEHVVYCISAQLYTWNKDLDYCSASNTIHTYYTNQFSFRSHYKQFAVKFNMPSLAGGVPVGVGVKKVGGKLVGGVNGGGVVPLIAI